MISSTLPKLNFHPLDTNEAFTPTSGDVFSDTRHAKPFQLIPSNASFFLDTEYNFTPKEMWEIYGSLIDLDLGNFKVFQRTEELFADLDSE